MNKLTFRNCPGRIIPAVPVSSSFTSADVLLNILPAYIAPVCWRCVENLGYHFSLNTPAVFRRDDPSIRLWPGSFASLRSERPGGRSQAQSRYDFWLL